MNTKIKEVKGTVAYNEDISHEKLLLRVTSDKFETLSIQYENIMFIVDYADVTKLVDVARKSYKYIK